MINTKIMTHQKKKISSRLHDTLKHTAPCTKKPKQKSKEVPADDPSYSKDFRNSIEFSPEIK